jgi:hypothetical protein
MRYCFILTGISTSFIKKLHIFIKLNNKILNLFDIYINFGSNIDDTIYLKNNFKYNSI